MIRAWYMLLAILVVSLALPIIAYVLRAVYMHLIILKEVVHDVLQYGSAYRVDRIFMAVEEALKLSIVYTNLDWAATPLDVLLYQMSVFWKLAKRPDLRKRFYRYKQYRKTSSK